VCCGLQFLGGDVVQALLQGGDLAEPFHLVGLGQTVAGGLLDRAVEQRDLAVR
jgi:hypothetical protein